MPIGLDDQIFSTVSGWCANACINGGAAIYQTYMSRSAEDGRTAAIDDFLNKYKDATHIFFLDSDTMPVDPMAINKMLAHNKPVVAGITPIFRRREFTENRTWSAKKFGDNQWIKDGELPKEPFNAEEVGGTTILIKREVFSKLQKPYQMTIKDIYTNQMIMSEDIFFSKRITEAGYDILVDPSIKCKHFKTVDILDYMKS